MNPPKTTEIPLRSEDKTSTHQINYETYKFEKIKGLEKNRNTLSLRRENLKKLIISHFI